MYWIGLGILYSVAYPIVGGALRDDQTALSWFRVIALLIPPITGTAVIARRRHSWIGCHAVFWSTIALGLAMSAIGLTGWAVDELVFSRMTWLAWPAIFALFGGIAPLFALLAQPHRGPRERLAATTAVDIAGLAVVTGFLYSFFITAPETSGGSLSLTVVSELQQGLVFAGMVVAMRVGKGTPWAATYRRLALGALVNFIALTFSNIEVGTGGYRSGFIYDLVWILPFAFYPWAASEAPGSEVEGAQGEDDEAHRPRPWVIFTAVALLPFFDFGLRRLGPQDGLSAFRDLSTAVAIISVLPLLVARIAAERAELQRAGSTTRLLAQIIEQAQELIVVLTPDGRCRHVNRAFCTATGIPPADARQLRAADVISDEATPAQEIQSLVDQGGTWRGTLTRRRPDGSTFPVSASIAALVDENGRPTHVVSVERDISEEQRLRQHLIHTERLSAVGQLVAGIAHELNNPLQAVLGFSELLLRSDVSPAIREDLVTITANSQRAARIVQQLLAFARHSTSQRSPADFNEIVQSTLALRTSELPAADITLIEEYHPDPLPVFVNQEEIRQVVLNLVLNAEQAIRSTHAPGQVAVRVGVDEFAFVDVSDDGPGVEPEISQRIFEPFFTTKPVGQGTGLGLSVSFGIAEAHGGSLTLRPRIRGACFRLSLPLTISERCASAPRAATTAAPVGVRV